MGKLLLLEDVDALGRKGEVVNVRPGFARNFLLPRQLAIVADKSALRMQARLKEEREKQAVVDKKESEELAGRLEGTTLSTVVKVDHDGHMYGSVSALDVLHLLRDQKSVELEKRAIQLPHPIKEIGVHKIKVKLKEGVTTTITLKVMSEEGQEFAEKETAPAAPKE